MEAAAWVAAGWAEGAWAGVVWAEAGWEVVDSGVAARAVVVMAGAALVEEVRVAE